MAEPDRDPFTGKIIFNRDRKFDLQLSDALIRERCLAEIFCAANIEKIELKSETWQWEQTGNIAIEYACDGQPSGIATTEADYWVHELRRDGRTLLYLMLPVERLKELARAAYQAGQHREHGGDAGRFSVVLLKLSDLLQ
jgi:hypothetical protein